MPVVNIFEAKTNLSKLVARVEQGEEIIIARNGKPAVRLTQLEPAAKSRIRFGGMKGKIWVADDFDELPEDLLEAFNNGDIFPPERPNPATPPQVEGATKVPKL
jgi:prevent-host-death family protein